VVDDRRGANEPLERGGEGRHYRDIRVPRLSNPRHGWALGDPESRKRSVSLTEEMLKEIQGHANRLDRSLSWVVQHAWEISRERIKKLPSLAAPPRRK
jgi:uncharacterized small protein (TIGR04563 family)